ncbi:MAG: hypothetical protein Q9191_000922 [Dirinaria sp. TL-2023a]
MSSKDMAAVYKTITTLTFDGFIRDLYTTFGMSKDGIRLMWQTSPTESLDASTGDAKQYHLGEGVHREQLHPGPHLDNITGKYLQQIQQQLVWSQIPAPTYSLKGKESKKVMLYDWCADILGHAGMNALYGDGLLQLEPRLLEYFYGFDQESWKLTFQLPPLFARDIHTTKDNAKKAYIHYFQLSLEKRSQACHYLRTVEAKQRQAVMSDADIGIAAQMFFWGANANPFKVCFWLLSYMIYDPDLLQSVRKEIASSVSSEGKVDLQSLLGHSPLLEAAFHETLRITSVNSSAREIKAPIVIGGKTLQPDGKLLMPYRQLHLEDAVFGPNTRTFDPSRSLKNEILSRSPSFKPFGGGSTYCSGRFIAKREIMAYVASVIHLYDLRLQNTSQPFPKMDVTKPTLGIMDPIKGDRLAIVISPREQARKA